MSNDFKRERRYIIFKITDLERHFSRMKRELLYDLADQIDKLRSYEGKAPREAVVVESDWPEYEPTWQAIEKRMKEVPHAD